MINADNFDNGGEGVAYHWQTSSNPANGNYRSNTGVGIQNTTDGGSNDNGYNIGYAIAGDWLKYSVNVTSSGTYTLSLRVSNRAAGGQLHLEVDGRNVTGTVNVPNTGSWTNWQTITVPNISLSSGQHVLKLAFDTNASDGFIGNVNWLKFS